LLRWRQFAFILYVVTNIWSIFHFSKLGGIKPGMPDYFYDTLMPEFLLSKTMPQTTPGLQNVLKRIANDSVSFFTFE
jgi:hypothetical protein